MEVIMKRNAVFAFASCFIAAAILFLTGCGKEESATVKSPEGKVTVTTKQDGGKDVVKIETKQGSLTIKPGQQAVSVAELGAPVYPGSEVVTSGQLDNAKGPATGIAATYMMSTNDSYDKVVSFYKANLKNIQQTMNHTIGDQKMTIFMSGKAGNVRSIQIVAKTSGGPTNIQVTRITEK